LTTYTKYAIIHNVNRLQKESTAGIGIGTTYLAGLWIEEFRQRLTGIDTLDDFLQYNLASIAGAAFGACAANLMFEAKYTIRAGLAVAAFVTFEEIKDSISYGNGMDYMDWLGGLVAIGTYVAFSRAVARK
jgi:hypothetical protein